MALAAEAPRTLFLVGAATALGLTRAEATCCALTATAALATGCALVKALWGTAVTAPGTVLLTYVMFVLLMFVTWLLYTFVMVVLLTFVLLMLTRFTYPRLALYPGT